MSEEILNKVGNGWPASYQESNECSVYVYRHGVPMIEIIGISNDVYV